MIFFLFGHAGIDFNLSKYVRLKCLTVPSEMVKPSSSEYFCTAAYFQIHKHISALVPGPPWGKKEGIESTLELISATVEETSHPRGPFSTARAQTASH